MGYKQAIGKLGEEKACEYIKKNKEYKIIEKNFRCKIGEIDIIAKNKNSTLIFIEVKTRKNNLYGEPSEAVDKTKRGHIRRVAQYYLLKNHIQDVNIRFDVIEIILGKPIYINYIKCAF